MLQDTLVNLKSLLHLLVPLEELDRIPPLLLVRHVVENSLLDMGNGMLNTAAEGVRRNHLNLSLHSLDCFGNSLLYSGSLEGRNLDNRAAKLGSQLLCINFIPLLGHNIHHVHSHHHRKPQLCQLCGQIKVTFQVGTVHYVEDCIRILINQVVTCNHFFQCIWRKGIDTRQVCDSHILISLIGSLFLLYSYSRPVSYKLVGTGKSIEQSCLTAVGVSGKCDFYHFSTSTISASNLRMESSYPRTVISTGSPRGATFRTEKPVPLVSPMSMMRRFMAPSPLILTTLAVSPGFKSFKVISTSLLQSLKPSPGLLPPGNL